VIARLPGSSRDLPPPLVLVADEDPQVVETIVAALQLHHYRVSVAEDGDEVLRRAHGESPDLIIASVRLKGRGGLELCGTLRREVDWGDMPILLLSSANDPEARVEALAHGADDLVTKPFSPRELFARAQRLVSRARETSRFRDRSQALERDVVRLESEARRARDEAERERSLRSLAGGLTSTLLRTTDVDELDARFLRECCAQTGARSAALLTQDRATLREGGVGQGPWNVTAVRGDLLERWSALALEADSACVAWLTALGRPALRSELERLAEMTRDVGELSAHGVAMLGVVPGGASMHGARLGPGAVVVCDERPDGAPFGALERERLGALCAAAAPARAVALRFREQQDRALDLVSEPWAADPRRQEAARESCDRLLALAARLDAPAADRAALARVLELGPWAWSDAGRAAIAQLAGEGPSGELRRMRELVNDADECSRGEPGASEDALPLLAAAGLRYQALRISGRSGFESWRTAASWLGVQGHASLRGEFPEALEPARSGTDAHGGAPPARGTRTHASRGNPSMGPGPSAR
jgi:DNA-binding response OmpR family regulator